MTYAPPPPPPPLPPPPPPYRPQANRSWWKAAWVLPVAAFAALIIGVGIGSATGKTTSTKEAGPTTHVTATATQTSTITTTPTVIKTTATKVKTHTVTYTPPVKVAFSDGTFRVNSEIKPGTYHTDPKGAACYWERDGKGTDNIIANDNITGPTTIDIASSDYAFTSAGGCAWVRKG